MTKSKHPSKPLEIVDNPDSDKGSPHSHHYKSEATTDKNRFFHGVKSENQGVTQTTNVTVNVQPDKQDDCITGCFKGLIKLFK